MQSAVRRLEGSRFYQRFLSRLRDAQIRNGLARVLGSGREFQMVVYGIGSIEYYDPPRLQLALAVLLRRELGPAVASVDVFDPVLSATECAVVRALGCTVVPVDEQGRREATVPSLFYMPHCEAALYDALLEANWRPAMLNRMVVLGNSFAAYEKYMEEVAWSNGSVALEAASEHILGVRRYVREVEMEEKGEVEASGEVKEEEEDGFFKAFHDTSWHFFELDDDIQMNSLKK
ncbi:putative protein SENSITIVITY TO RED LIGHT REDUCED 1 [Cocos nucifera]|uniref:SRR1-like domain-containing protein n=1 Tax=Cocos nucifera TaxID=13894 RepID=A0A8K0N1D7_COCNU|nr:putative protein SENSITIVITY TO RED LIGHT REDUCED 1 [Cocos nucifera]